MTKGNTAVDLEFSTLRVALAWGQRKDLIEEVPLAELWPRFTQGAEIRHCRDAAPRDPEELHYIAKLLLDRGAGCETAGWQLLFESNTGVRTSEALMLRDDASPYAPGWLTPDGGSLYVRRVKHQEDVCPFVKVHEGLDAFLDAWRMWKAARYPDSPWYFPSRNVPARPEDAAPLSSTALVRALANDVEPVLGRRIISHGARAYYVMIRRSQGAADWEIAREIGHTSHGKTIARVYGAIPPAWLDGKGPQLGWLPQREPAWADLVRRIQAKT